MHTRLADDIILIKWKGIALLFVICFCLAEENKRLESFYLNINENYCKYSFTAI